MDEDVKALLIAWDLAKYEEVFAGESFPTYLPFWQKDPRFR